MRNRPEVIATVIFTDAAESVEYVCAFHCALDLTARGNIDSLDVNQVLVRRHAEGQEPQTIPESVFDEWYASEHRVEMRPGLSLSAAVWFAIEDQVYEAAGYAWSEQKQEMEEWSCW